MAFITSLKNRIFNRPKSEDKKYPYDKYKNV